MKKFTKGALITVLVFTVLGFILCAVGAGIGFHYTSIPKMINEGVFNIGTGHWGTHWNKVWNWDDAWNSDFESWNDAVTEKYDFSIEECADIKNLNLVVDYSSVEIEEAGNQQGIHVEVKYRKENSKRDISVSKEGNTLKIEENGYAKLLNNDSVYISVQIPADMEFEEVQLENPAGEIKVDHALHAKNISVIVGAGECVINKELQIAGTVYAQVDAGEIDFARINAEKIELNTGVGEIDVEKAAADEVILDCGVGELNITLDGRETDYSYNIDCGVGEVTVGGSNYSGLGTTRKVEGGSRKVDISCGVGEITVDFTK